MRVILSAAQVGRYEAAVKEECMVLGGFSSHRTRLTLPPGLHFADPRLAGALRRVLTRADARVAASLGGAHEAAFWRERQTKEHAADVRRNREDRRRVRAASLHGGMR